MEELLIKEFLKRGAVRRDVESQESPRTIFYKKISSSFIIIVADDSRSIIYAYVRTVDVTTGS